MVADWFFAVKWLIIGLIATAAVNKAIAIMFQYNKADFFFNLKTNVEITLKKNEKKTTNITIRRQGEQQSCN
jgi:hypothetical protein